MPTPAATESPKGGRRRKKRKRGRRKEWWKGWRTEIRSEKCRKKFRAGRDESGHEVRKEKEVAER